MRSYWVARRAERGEVHRVGEGAFAEPAAELLNFSPAFGRIGSKTHLLKSLGYVKESSDVAIGSRWVRSVQVAPRFWQAGPAFLELAPNRAAHT